MVTSRSWKRLKKYGIKEILLSKYLILPLVITIGSYFLISDLFSNPGMRNFVSSATGVSQSLIAVTLTGLAILVSFSDKKFLSFLRKNDTFEKLLAIFEYTVTLAIITSFYGVFLQSVSFEKWVFFIFFFLFIHLLASISALVSTILRFSETKAKYEGLKDFDEGNMSEEMKEDLDHIRDQISTENSSSSESVSDDEPELEKESL
ncbi:hypothetical protein [Natrialba aegyptia]|uniref:Uncharacterized protein n=1 Tax=Natrialba aegyptia DSM 13077 TaxID=1227491 RepID=M0B0E2_9EURY|nr:hypothetical protein [Natrialba aegyptia]ELZ03688.1 hypothetical protein C480_15025 [Natrialba aegyptia DSM 13077]